MNTTRSINGQPVSREQLKDFAIADQRVLTIVERARRRSDQAARER